MAMGSSSNHMACLLKIESSTSGWEKSLEKLLMAFNDVSFTIDKQSKTVYAYGRSDPQRIVEKIRKAGKKVEIVWSNNGSHKPQENRKEHVMDQCHASGFINAPNGFVNYHHQQQCYNPPPPNWMNYYPQPHHQTCALPTPYPRQLHPQPPIPYEFHQNESAAKSFPPTPPPPKNFTMGDLQPGCNIM